jgi:carboxyl-terminal processing protease
MRSRIQTIISVLSALLIFASGLIAGYAGHWYLYRNTPTATDSEHFSVFWEAWNIVQDRFYGDIPDGATPVYGALHGALGTLEDPYTIFVEPEPRAIERAELQGQFGGIGAYVTRGEAGEVILTPMVDSPAEKAGILADDILVKVEDTLLTPEMTSDEVVLLIRGEVNTQVRLTVTREGEPDPIEIVVTRQTIETPSVEWQLLDEAPNIGYIRIRLFTERTGRETVRALQELKGAGIDSLILDLRDNGGGVLDAAVDVTSQFIGEGSVLYETRRDQPEKEYRVKKGGEGIDIPLTILVNGGTASASEIVAGALRDYERGVLIGQKTFGKGSVQQVYDLSDDSSLHVTVARWLTPNRHQIDGEGLTPTIEVAITEEDRQAGTDPQLEQAIQYLQQGRAD